MRTAAPPEGEVGGWTRGPAPSGHPGWTYALAAVLVVGLGLRLWGLQHGLPFIYNLDEGAHFVPKAISYFKGSFDPNYFINPPAFSYVLHFVFDVWFGGRDGASHAYAVDPTALFTVARATTAVLGVGALAMLYAAGRRFYDERVGVVAAAIMAVAFLPVFYSKLALNDVPTLLPAALSLYGTAGLMSRDLRRDWVYAGAGLGLACATKYTGGIVIAPLLVAVGHRLYQRQPWREVAVGVAIAGAVAGAGFFLANPYALITPREFGHDVLKQQTAAGDLGKLGQAQSSGHVYYLWTLTWGLGWAAALAALGGAIAAYRDCRARFLALALPPILFIAYMGAQGRFFGRWVLPALPFLCLLAAFFAVWAWEWVRARTTSGTRPGLRRLAAVALGTALLGQGLVYSIHSGRVLAREDTRAEARRYLVKHVPPGGKIFMEPIVPQSYLQDPGRPLPVTNVGDRWFKYPTGKSTIYNNGRRVPGGKTRVVNVEDYERIARPALLRGVRGNGYCWVMIGSTQFGRAFRQPEKVPNALRFYRLLNRQGVPVFAALPYDRQGQVRFNFDWSFDYYPLAYDRPGPEVFIYRYPARKCPPLPRPSAQGLSFRGHRDG
jgi:Dolichyl-phosphate-mannose-protein mannosyltransferase